MFTSTMAFIKKNSQATTKCDAERNWSTFWLHPQQDRRNSWTTL